MSYAVWFKVLKLPQTEKTVPIMYTQSNLCQGRSHAVFLYYCPIFSDNVVCLSSNMYWSGLIQLNMERIWKMIIISFIVIINITFLSFFLHSLQDLIFGNGRICQGEWLSKVISVWQVLNIFSMSLFLILTHTTASRKYSGIKELKYWLRNSINGPIKEASTNAISLLVIVATCNRKEIQVSIKSLYIVFTNICKSIIMPMNKKNLANKWNIKTQIWAGIKMGKHSKSTIIK